MFWVGTGGFVCDIGGWHFGLSVDLSVAGAPTVVYPSLILFVVNDTGREQFCSLWTAIVSRASVAFWTGSFSGVPLAREFYCTFVLHRHQTVSLIRDTMTFPLAFFAFPRAANVEGGGVVVVTCGAMLMKSHVYPSKCRIPVEVCWIERVLLLRQCTPRQTGQ